MTTPLSLTAGVAFAAQSLKGTAATTNFIRARAGMSSAIPRFDLVESLDEHTGIHERPTRRQSIPIRTGVLIDIAARCGLYPDCIGYALLMAGFKVSTTPTSAASEVQLVTITGTPTGGTFTLTFGTETTGTIAYNAAAADVQTALRALTGIGATGVGVTGSAGGPYTCTFAGSLANKNVAQMTASATGLTGGTDPAVTVTTSTPGTAAYYTHVFTLADRDEVGWASMLHALGEGTARFERKITDCRWSQLDIKASRRNITWEGKGLGLSEAASAGTEVIVADTNALISMAAGSWSMTSDSVSLIASPRGHDFSIAQGLAEDDPTLHTTTRADLPLTGTDITGVLRGIDLDYATYRKLMWGGTSGTGPSLVVPEATMSWTYQSPGNMTDCSLPYLMTTAIDTATVSMGNFEASGNELVRFDASYQMQDRSSSAPITITLRNLRSSYAGS